MQHTDTGRDRGKKAQHAQNNQRSQQGKQGQQQKRGSKAQARAPRMPQQRSSVPGVQAAISSSPSAARHGCTRLGPVRLCLHLRRRYVDHPSFGMAIISRVLDAHGYKVGIICQPIGPTPPASRCSASRAWLSRQRRQHGLHGQPLFGDQAPPPHRRLYPWWRGGAPSQSCRHGLRQPHPPDVQGRPIIIGGIEASLRRLAHYDYWQDKLKRSVLLDSGADILIYGMGEHAIVEIADALDAGLPVDQITYINGTVYRTSSLDEVYDYDLLPSWDDLAADKLNYARSFNVQQQNMDPITGHRLVEPYPNSVYVVQNPPSATLTTDEMDEVAELPYARDWHPDYDAAGGVPAFAEIKFSISSNRGCFGECSFAPSPSTRAAYCKCAATIRSCARPSCSRAIPSLRLHQRCGRTDGKL